MNSAEKRAEQWLRTQNKILAFQHRKSPDFICGDGTGYEVKLLRENTITFTQVQMKALREFQNQLTILVFTDKSKIPRYTIPFGELVGGYWNHIRIVVYDGKRK